MSSVISLLSGVQNLVSLSCRKHSFIYQSLSISTVADPLSADLIKMSLRFLSACRSREVKLSRTGSGF